jgi:KDO2-lipid IV(A) lauroyltransferase
MKSRKAYAWIIYRFLEGSCLAFLALSKLLPPAFFHCLSSPFLKLVIHAFVPRRRVRRNLQRAFGAAYSPATINGLAKGVQDHFVKNLSDCIRHMAEPDRTLRAVTIEGHENLQAALSRGKGVIALGAHIGNFVLVGARLGMIGYRFHTLFRVPSEKKLRDFVDRHLPYFHQRVIPSRPRRVAVKRILEALKRNEIVFILGDNLKKGPIETILFGQRVPSPRGPVSLALRSGAPVVPMYLIRNYVGELRLVIEPEIVMSRNGSMSQDITDNTRQIVRYLEDLIRSYPDQWNWLTVRMRRSQPRPAMGR